MNLSNWTHIPRTLALLTKNKETPAPALQLNKTTVTHMTLVKGTPDPRHLLLKRKKCCRVQSTLSRKSNGDGSCTRIDVIQLL